MHRPSDPAARWRGAAAALLTAALAVGAHAVGNGSPPSGAGLALIMVLASTVGAALATSRRAPSTTTLLAILASGQVIGHYVVAAAGHHHAAPGLPVAPMIAAHVVAVVAGAVLIAGADRLFRALSTAMRGAAGPSHPLAVAATSPVVAGDQPHQAMLLLAASVSHRGPPVSLPR